MKEQKGITLVALVITIIVLLILAGVTISLVVGDNGILGHATNAVSTNARATALQDIKLGAADALTAYYADWATNQAETRGKYLKNVSYYNANKSDSAGTITVTNAASIEDSAETGTVNVSYATNGATYTYTVNIATGEVTDTTTP